MRSVLTAALFACVPWVAAPAHGQPLRPAQEEWLRYESAPGCPDKGEFLRMLDQRLGEDSATVANAQGVLATVRLKQAHRTFQGAIELRDHQGTLVGVRSIERDGPACAPTADALLFACSLLLTSPPWTHAENGPNPPKKDLPPPIEPTTVVREARPGVATSPVEAELTVGVSVLGSRGLLPGVAPGLGGRATYTPTGGFVWALAFAHQPEREAAQDSSHGARLSVWSAAVSGCPRWRWSTRWSSETCMGMGAGLVRATSYGFQTRRHDSQWLVSLDGEVGISARFARAWFVRGGAGLRIPLLRHRVFVGDEATGRTVVFQPAWVDGVVTTWLGYIF